MADTSNATSEDGVITVALDLRIENTYELYADVTTSVQIEVPAPPASDSDDYQDWAYQYIYAETGVGHTDGDSWYDVEVVGSSDASLVGRKFEFGY